MRAPVGPTAHHTTGVPVSAPHPENRMSITPHRPPRCARCEQSIVAPAHYREPRPEGVLVKHTSEAECLDALKLACTHTRALIMAVLHWHTAREVTRAEWVEKGESSPSNTSTLNKASDDLAAQVEAYYARLGSESA